MSLTRAFFSGVIVLPLAHACPHALAQTSSPIETAAPATASEAANLPDSPGTVLRRRMQPLSDPAGESTETASASDPAAPQAQGSANSAGADARASDNRRTGDCVTTAGAANGIVESKPNTPGATNFTPASNASSNSSTALTPPPTPCASRQNPYQRFLNNGTPIPLTPRQKAYLAVHNFIDPGNIVTILGTSGIAIASDSHTAYGPGWRGFGRDAGISAVQDATGDFFGTFLIPSLAHEDPHYHRMPNASIPRRTLHAISRTVIAQSDDGKPMPNYATLLTYPITAEIANLYVPGVATNGPSTVERVLTGYATDPIDNLITEFLPDVAKRIHVRVIFVQQIINQVAAGQPINMFP